MFPYLGFSFFSVVFTTMFARVVFGQLVVTELLELVGHRFLQARWQRATETLETKTPKVTHQADVNHKAEGQQGPYGTVDPDNFQPVRGQLHSSTEVSANMRLGGGLTGSQGQ